MGHSKDPMKILRSELLRQGFKIKDSTKGYLVFPPNREFSPVAVHKTPASNKRSFENLIAELRRRGFDWKK